MLKKENPSGFYVDPVLSRFCPGTKRKNGIINCKSINYSVYSCGDPTRTNDLWVMSPTSYQLLHSAMFCECKGTAFDLISKLFLDYFSKKRSMILYCIDNE